MKFKKTLSILLALCMVLSLLPAMALAVEITGWAQLQAAFSAGGSVILQQDVTAGAGDSALTVPSGKEVTLDLNGHTIDRGLANAEAKTNGNVITNNGTLTITDSSAAKTGTITGGNNAGNGGAIWSDSTLTVTNGTISGNTASLSGGAMYISGGTVTISGGTISGNTASAHGGAIYVYGDATVLNLFGGSITHNTAAQQGGAILKYQDANTVNIQGSPVIMLNHAAAGPDIYMRNNSGLLNVTGALGADARIGVTLAQGVGTVTSDFGRYNGSDRLACFIPSNSAYEIQGLPAGADGTLEVVTATAGTGPVNYVKRSWDSVNKQIVETMETCYSYELLHSSNSSWYTVGQENQTTWYVARGSITMNGTTLTVRGNVNIILCDGANVQIKDGIEVKTGYSLTIYGQSGDTGRLDARNNDGDAGIGCGPNSGVGDITFHGGTIEAHGGKYAAGIGSGDERQMGSHITIYGGDIKAYGGAYGAGIGSGDETGGTNGYIDIYGGTVYAKGGTDGAGIGGGNEGNSRNITIWGGNVTAISGSNQAAGIGGGDDGGGGTITINGGTVYAEGYINGPGIGGDTNCGTIVINGGDVTAVSENGAGIGGAYDEDLEKGSITINGGNVTATTGDGSLGVAAGIGSGYEEMEIPITINGGTVTVTGSEYGAGIGSGGDGGDCNGPITITGGHVTAIAPNGGAGIGSGYGGDCNGQITISGGYVEARSNGTIAGAGIGAGQMGAILDGGANVTKPIKITGGTIVAKGTWCAIGAGRGGTDKGVELYYDAKVTTGRNEDSATLRQASENRSKMVSEYSYAKIEPCDHPDALYHYSDDYFHARQCIYCEYTSLEPHSDGSGCVCGYHNPIRTVVLNSLEGIETHYIHEGTYYKLPFSEGQIITDGNGNYMRVTGWQESGDPSAPLSAPGVL